MVRTRCVIKGCVVQGTESVPSGDHCLEYNFGSTFQRSCNIHAVWLPCDDAGIRAIRICDKAGGFVIRDLQVYFPVHGIILFGNKHVPYPAAVKGESLFCKISHCQGFRQQTQGLFIPLQ